LYFGVGSERYLQDARVQGVIVESEKSVLAIASAAIRVGRSLLIIGTGGCNGWQGKIGKRPEPDGTSGDERGPLPDFHLVNWEKRDAVIAFDSDSKINVNVRSARRRLATYLTARGAIVRVADLSLLVRPDSGRVE
jgi:hypothetical protein